jgi:hypothetical protein
MRRELGYALAGLLIGLAVLAGSVLATLALVGAFSLP